VSGVERGAEAGAGDEAGAMEEAGTGVFSYSLSFSEEYSRVGRTACHIPKNPRSIG
jgi:hypothetical protein